MKLDDRGVKFPLTPGNEVSGIREDIVESLIEFQKEDKVLISPWISDELCHSCKASDEHLCESPQTLGIY
jgi:alcohol dehydrogenase, propanol-preferring